MLRPGAVDITQVTPLVEAGVMCGMQPHLAIQQTGTAVVPWPERVTTREVVTEVM